MKFELYSEELGIWNYFIEADSYEDVENEIIKLIDIVERE